MSNIIFSCPNLNMNSVKQQEIDNQQNSPSLLDIDDTNFEIINEWYDRGIFIIGSSQFRKNISIQKFNYFTKIWTPLLKSAESSIRGKYFIEKLAYPKMLIISNNLKSIYMLDVERNTCRKIDSDNNCIRQNCEWKICKLADGLISISSDLKINSLSFNDFQWCSVEPSRNKDNNFIPQNRIGFEVIHYREKIFILGGRSFCQSHCTFNEVPVFCTKEKLWKSVPTLPDPEHGYPEERQNHSAFYYENSAYIVGGTSLNTGNVLNEIWQCHLHTLKWKKLSVIFDNSNMSLTKCTITKDGQIIICGYDKVVGSRRLLRFNLNEHFVPTLESIVLNAVIFSLQKTFCTNRQLKLDLINLGLNNYYVSKICW